MWDTATYHTTLIRARARQVRSTQPLPLPLRQVLRTASSLRFEVHTASGAADMATEGEQKEEEEEEERGLCEHLAGCMIHLRGAEQVALAQRRRASPQEQAQARTVWS